MAPENTRRMVLFASGSGSNVENIVRYFQDEPAVSISCVLTNKRNAAVLDRCDRLKVNALYFNRSAFYAADGVLGILKALDPHLIVLAGFLLKVPRPIVDAFAGRIVNIHPALLPKYGGKGMYGEHVHRAVKEHGEPETGITVHYVNEAYDQGAVIAQHRTEVGPNDTVAQIAEKVHALEYAHYPPILAKLLGL